MSNFLGGMNAIGHAKLNGQDLATQIYVDAAIAGVSGDKFYAEVDTSLAEYITRTGYDGTQIGESDILFLANAPKGARRYWNSGEMNGDATDFVNVDEVLTDVEVQAALSAGQGLSYSGGAFSITNGAVTPQMLSAEVTGAMGDAIGFAGDIVGDGVATEFTVNHNAGTEDIVYSIRDKQTGDYEAARFSLVDTNNTKVIFAVAPADGYEYRITIKRVS